MRKLHKKITTATAHAYSPFHAMNRRFIGKDGARRSAGRREQRFFGIEINRRPVAGDGDPPMKRSG